MGCLQTGSVLRSSSPLRDGVAHDVTRDSDGGGGGGGRDGCSGGGGGSSCGSRTVAAEVVRSY